jgi:serine/threonine protein kinase
LFAISINRKSFNIIRIVSRNMLLTERNEIKLADLGWSKTMDKTHASTFAGSPAYMSPEVFKADVLETEYYPNTDIWY